MSRPTKPKLSRQDLMAFFQDIIQGDAGGGDGVPSMEQRMKAAVTFMALLDKQPEEEDGVLTFKVTHQQVQEMQDTLHHSWKHALKQALHYQKKRDGGHRQSH